MKIFYVCRQKYEEDRVTKMGDIQYVTVTNGLSENLPYAAIFKEEHALYKMDKHQREYDHLTKDVPDLNAKFFIEEVNDQ